jgi:ribonuclease HI
MTSGNNVLHNGKFFQTNQNGYVETTIGEGKNWIPARITMRGGTIRSVRTNSISINTIHDKRIRLKGQTLSTSNEPILENVENGFIAAADGTVKNGRGGGAYTIHSNSGTKGVVNGRIPVDGHQNYMTSYRTELASILAALLKILELMNNDKQFYDDITGILWCDNQTAVNKYNKLEGVRPRSMREANEDDNDIIQELRIVKDNLPKGIKCSWVKSHQTNGKTQQSRLNTIVDKIADTQHTTSGNQKSRNNTSLLPSQQALLVHNGTAVTAKADKHIQQFVWNDQLEQYFYKRLNINPDLANEIDFTALDRFNKSLSTHRRCTRAKFVYRWAPTNERLHTKYREAKSPNCPMCQQIETTYHISRCKSKTTTIRREHELEMLERTLEQENTDPAIIVIFITALTNDEHEKNFPTEINNNTITQAMELQKKIGWNNFELGVLARKWRDAQAQYLKTEEDMTQLQIQTNTTKWVKIVQECLWKYISGLWESRCQFIHGIDKNSNYQKTRSKLKVEIEKLKSTESRVGAADRHLFTDETTRHITSVRNMKLWIKAVKLAVRKEACIRYNEINNQRKEQRREWLKTLGEQTEEIKAHRQVTLDKWIIRQEKGNEECKPESQMPSIPFQMGGEIHNVT